MTTAASGHPRMLDGFLDSLVQTLENRRHGLTDEDLKGGSERLREWAEGAYAGERPRLQQVVAQQVHLDAQAQTDLLATVDDLVRRVVIPGWARLAGAFTPAERNAFFLVKPALHGAERFAWALLGVVVGLLVIRAPFLPLWADGWVLAFMVGGFFFPAIRRFLALRRYERALDDIVAAADREIFRRDVEYATGQRLGAEAQNDLESGAQKPGDRSRVR